MAGLVQIRNVPDETRRELKARAAARGESLNEYLLKMLIEQSKTMTVREVLERAASRSERSKVSSVDVIREDRDSRS